jgi:hypothetical protein
MKSINIASRLSVATAVLVGILSLTQPTSAEARGGGGGGGHAGGFGGGFHGGGFHGGFDGRGYHRGFGRNVYIYGGYTDYCALGYYEYCYN